MGGSTTVVELTRKPKIILKLEEHWPNTAKHSRSRLLGLEAATQLIGSDHLTLFDPPLILRTPSRHSLSSISPLLITPTATASERATLRYHPKL